MRYSQKKNVNTKPKNALKSVLGIDVPKYNIFQILGKNHTILLIMVIIC